MINYNITLVNGQNLNLERTSKVIPTTEHGEKMDGPPPLLGFLYVTFRGGWTRPERHSGSYDHSIRTLYSFVSPF